MILKVGEHGIKRIEYKNRYLDFISIPKNHNEIIYIDFKKNVIVNDFELECESSDDAIKLLEYLDLMLLPEELRLLKLNSL